MLLNNEEYLNVLHKVVTSPTPSLEKLPPVLEVLPQIYKLLVYKALRPEKMIDHCTEFIKNSIGE